MNLSDVEIIAMAKAQDAVINNIAAKRFLIETTDDTLTEFFSFEPLDQTAGLLILKGVGFDGADVITGQRLYAYKKVSDVVTVTEIGTAAVHEDTGVSTAEFSAVADSANISFNVLGVDGLEIAWHLEYDLLMVEKTVSL